MTSGEKIETAAMMVGEIAERIGFQPGVDLAIKVAQELRVDGAYHLGNPAMVDSIPDRIGRLMQLWGGDVGGIPNSPGPLSSMLVMAPLGAVAGIGAGYLGNKLTGGHLFNNTLVNALLGAGIGTLPGLGYAGLNYAGGLDPLSGTILDTPKATGVVDSVDSLNKASSYGMVRRPQYISVDGIKEMIYTDPYVAPYLTPDIQAATAGLFEGAQYLPGKRNTLPIVTPSDIGRMAIGLGSGYAAGTAVGAVLGGILGMDETAKQTLRQSGAVAGLVKALVPLAYGA